MEVPVGFDLKQKKKDFCLKLRKNIYWTKQAGRVWNRHMNKGQSNQFLCLLDVMRKAYICEEFCEFLLLAVSSVDACTLIAAIVICP
jgi:hypothetical protein